MPLYTYACDHHGEFSAWGKLATSDEPQPCPSCATPAPRALARPAIGGRGGEDGGFEGCGAGDCCTAPSPAAGGHVCGAGCVH
ncbi:MAG TPA: zinc ribbon domain-containing protein [Geminicoccaceae bacterium]|nr:zinc ribbon domain-containing protein [Geminicoccus sp.]HMU50341.1 zinc ribbon domain-containing protein [Geminicoccaceae bacterium]